MITPMMCRVFEIEEKTKEMEKTFKKELEGTFFDTENEAYHWLNNAADAFEDYVGDIMPESLARELSRCAACHVIK